MDFNDPRLVKEYGSWVRVQVEFYDFLFTESSKLRPSDWKDRVKAEWRDGKDLYESWVKRIEDMFVSPADAWEAFLKIHGESL